MTTTAPKTSRMASMAAWYELFFSSRMWRSMFSMTTIASSTTIPVASTIPNRVRVLIEKPKSFTKAKVPISETGIVMAGMSVLRQFWRNRNMTRITRTMASSRVTSTSLIDSRTTPTLSKARRHSRPGGKFFSSRAISFMTPW